MACRRSILLTTSNEYRGYFGPLFGPGSFGGACRTACFDGGGLKYCCRRHGDCECIILLFTSTPSSSVDVSDKARVASIVVAAQRMGGVGEHGVAVKSAAIQCCMR